VLREFTPANLPITNGDGSIPSTDLTGAYNEFLI
jgi:hypothetical protein